MTFSFCVGLGDLWVKPQPHTLPYTTCSSELSQELGHIVGIQQVQTRETRKCADDLSSDRRFGP